MKVGDACVCGWRLPKNIVIDISTDDEPAPAISFECPLCGRTLKSTTAQLVTIDGMKVDGSA